MGAGKGFSIAGGVLILVATYALAWYMIDVSGNWLSVNVLTQRGLLNR